MNMLNTNRRTRFGLLPTVMLLLALGAGFASVGQAEETALGQAKATMVRPAAASQMRNEIRSTAHRAIWLTRVNVATDLGVRLNSQQRPFRLASRDMGKRG